MGLVKLDKLQKRLAWFFENFGRKYSFLLADHDYRQSEKKRYYCICFNDDESHEDSETNFLIKFLTLRTGGLPHADQLGKCVYFHDNGSIEQLTNHYLDHHPSKIFDFLKFIEFHSEDRNMRGYASRILESWDEREEERALNTPRSSSIGVQDSHQQANVSFNQNEDEMEQDYSPEPERSSSRMNNRMDSSYNMSRSNNPPLSAGPSGESTFHPNRVSDLVTMLSHKLYPRNKFYRKIIVLLALIMQKNISVIGGKILSS
ncbi:uncharacterized protein LOC141850966 [Brevipalpus obovatus]|uniref:uncharacterized protein LOC141850966 n=1 Tax=Brevipalpus obovatus TaxID=246614 RepID=UPI003D9E303B